MPTGEPEVRGVRRDDPPALLALLTAAEEVDRQGESIDLDDLREQLDNPMIDPARDWLVVESEGELVASSVLWPRAPVDGVLDLHVDGAVHPRVRGRGLGSLLLPRMLDRARAHVHERGEHLTPLIRAQTTSANAAADELLTSAGFVAERWNFLMEAGLADVPDLGHGITPDGFTVVTWEEADHDEIRAAHNLAFGGHHPGFTPWDEEMWEHLVSGARAFRPSLSLLLRDREGAPAAYVQTNEYAAVREATGLREAFVAKVGTTPDHRRRGLASVLLARALELYRADGFDRAALDVDAENPSGALGIYERAGFRTVQRFTRYRLP